MKVAAYQAPLLPISIEEAVGLVADQVRTCESDGVDVLCCPEAILGGLADNSRHSADLGIHVASGQLQTLLAPLASDAVTTIVGFTESGPANQLFNSAAIFSQGEVIGVYRKMHPAINRSVYQPGLSAGVYRVGDFVFGILICRDSTYPELARTMVADGARVLFIPTNNALPTHKGGPNAVEDARKTDIGLIAQCRVPVVRADVAGRSDDIESYGSSWILDGDGSVLTASTALKPGLLVADILT